MEEEGQANAEKRARLEPDTADLVVLIDMSGSMEPQRNTMIPALERMLRHTVAQTPAEQRDLKSLQVWFFAVECDKVLSISFAGLGDSPPGLGLTYEPQGMTALYDSIVAILPHCAPGATLFIATDGENTVEAEETKESAKKALARARDERRLKVLALAEGAGAAQEMRVLEVEQLQSAHGDVLSQALDDENVLLQLSQSLAAYE